MVDSSMVAKYSKDVEKDMQNYFMTLNEKEKRIYAATEVAKLGFGGIKYISNLLSIDPKTIKRGKEELKSIENNSEKTKRIRKIGGGRKKLTDKTPEIEENFLKTVEKYKAGSPMDEGIIWIDVSIKKFAEEVSSLGIKVSRYTCKQLLKKHKFGIRKMSKTQSLKEVENRNEQFENINRLVGEYEKSDNPIISIDVKKKK